MIMYTFYRRYNNVDSPFSFFSEFVPYVFQIFSQLLELHTEPVFPETYRSMLPALLTPAIWENAGKNFKFYTSIFVISYTEYKTNLFLRQYSCFD